VYYMLKNSKLFVEAEDLDELREFRNINKSGIFKVEAHPTVFPFVDVILWILMNIEINSRYVCKERKEPIASSIPMIWINVIILKL
jgi:hypothetical protein